MRRKEAKLSVGSSAEAGSGVALGGDNVVGSREFPPVGRDLRESASRQGGWDGVGIVAAGLAVLSRWVVRVSGREAEQAGFPLCSAGSWFVTNQAV